jgi:hypothetical protein
MREASGIPINRGCSAKRWLDAPQGVSIQFSQEPGWWPAPVIDTSLVVSKCTTWWRPSRSRKPQGVLERGSVGTAFVSFRQPGTFAFPRVATLCRMLQQHDQRWAAARRPIAYPRLPLTGTHHHPMSSRPTVPLPASGSGAARTGPSTHVIPTGAVHNTPSHARRSAVEGSRRSPPGFPAAPCNHVIPTGAAQSRPWHPQRSAVEGPRRAHHGMAAAPGNHVIPTGAAPSRPWLARMQRRGGISSRARQPHPHSPLVPRSSFLFSLSSFLTSPSWRTFPASLRSSG